MSFKKYKETSYGLVLDMLSYSSRTSIDGSLFHLYYNQSVDSAWETIGS